MVIVKSRKKEGEEYQLPKLTPNCKKVLEIQSREVITHSKIKNAGITKSRQSIKNIMGRLVAHGYYDEIGRGKWLSTNCQGVGKELNLFLDERKLSDLDEDFWRGVERLCEKQNIVELRSNIFKDFNCALKENPYTWRILNSIYNLSVHFGRTTPEILESIDKELSGTLSNLFANGIYPEVENNYRSNIRSRIILITKEIKSTKILDNIVKWIKEDSLTKETFETEFKEIEADLKYCFTEVDPKQTRQKLKKLRSIENRHFQKWLDKCMEEFIKKGHYF